MASPMTAAQERVAMRKWLGAHFKEYSGWTTRKRPGSFAPVGIVIHHTGSDSGQNSSNYDHFLFVEGRPAEGIPGPLCHATCEMDGDVIVGAIGRANHAGSGSSSTLSLVRADKASLTSEIRPGRDNTNGNGWFYGLEVKFDGGQPMTAKQYDSAVRYAAAICDHHGWTAGSIIGHKEWSSRKPDPGHTSMAKFRRDVAARLKAGPGGVPTGDTGKPPVDEGDFTVAEADRVIAQINAVSGHLSDNNRQWANNIISAVNEKVAALQADVDSKIEYLEGRVQAYAAFGAKHTDQVEATTAGDVDAVLAKKFSDLNTAVSAIVELQKTQGQALDAVQAALAALVPEEPPMDGGDDAPKA